MISDKVNSEIVDLYDQGTSFEDFCSFIIENKYRLDITWQDMADLGFEIYGEKRSEGFYRKKAKKLKSSELSDTLKNKLENDKERVKISDERNQIRAYIRKLAREDVYKEAVLDAVKEISSRKQLSLVPYHPSNCLDANSNEGILCISDWHYGIECHNAWNSYNESIAADRIKKLRDETIRRGIENKISTLHVLNLGDMIAGLIHLTLRLESRSDVITQTMKVSELIAELLSDLSQYFKIEYYSCLDNHSRLDPNKNDSLDNESLARITDWYLEERLKGLVHINNNKFGKDIITFTSKGWNILGVHGDKDRPDQIIDSISRMTESHYDLICTAHRHHFSCDEKNRTVIVANSSLMGTDDYSKNLRLSAHPSQNLIVVSDKCPCDAIYRMVLD